MTKIEPEKEALRLPPEERLELAQALWESASPEDEASARRGGALGTAFSTASKPTFLRIERFPERHTANLEVSRQR